MVQRRRPRQLIKNTHTTPTHIASHFLSSRCLNGLVWKMLICARTHTHFFRIVFSSSLKHLHLAELMNTHTHCHSAAATLALAHKSYKLYNQRKESKKKTTTAYRAYLHFNKLKCVSARKRQHILHLSNVLSFYVCVWLSRCLLPPVWVLLLLFFFLRSVYMHWSWWCAHNIKRWLCMCFVFW